MNQAIYEILEALTNLLEDALEEYKKLPRSLGYEFDRIPEYEAKIQKAREFLDKY